MAIVKPIIDQKGWQEWVKSRPKKVQKLIERLPPDRLYLLKTTNDRITIYSYSENGTVTVDVTGDYNLLDFQRRVFGIRPDDLEECDLPDPDEELGVLLTDEETEALLERVRRQQGYSGGHKGSTCGCAICGKE